MATAAAPRWVEERKRKLDGRLSRFVCECLSWAPERLVLLYRMQHEATVADGALHVPADALSYGVYWAWRPYNVYQWVLPGGRTLAYYCNVATDTVITPEAVEWLDLEVDVLIRPDGGTLVLDEDEVPAELSPGRRLAIEAARTDLVGRSEAVAREVSRLTRPFRKALSPGAGGRGPNGRRGRAKAGGGRGGR